MRKKKIEVKGLTIKVDEKDYVSLTDIAKQTNKINSNSGQEP